MGGILEPMAGNINQKAIGKILGTNLKLHPWIVMFLIFPVGNYVYNQIAIVEQLYKKLKIKDKKN